MLVGDVRTVSAYTARRLVEVETEDTAVAILRFGCGALGVLEATTATRPKDLECSISVLWAKAAPSRSAASRPMRCRHLAFRGPALPEDESVLAEFATKPAGQDRAFAHAQVFVQRGCQRAQSSGEIVDGQMRSKTVRLIEALYRGRSEQGTEIVVPRAASIGSTPRSCPPPRCGG